MAEELARGSAEDLLRMLPPDEPLVSLVDRTEMGAGAWLNVGNHGAGEWVLWRSPKNYGRHWSYSLGKPGIGAVYRGARSYKRSVAPLDARQSTPPADVQDAGGGE